MGGNVAVSIRNSDNTFIKMDRWTNVMPYWFSHSELYTGSFEAWRDDFISQWLTMKDDYERNKDSGKFDEFMTSAYFPFDTTSPSEYGLIAVDAINKKIYTAQDYCSIGTIPFYKLDDDESFENLHNLYQAGVITEISFLEPSHNENKQWGEKAFSLKGIESDKLLKNISLIIKYKEPYFLNDEDTKNHALSYAQQLDFPFNQMSIIDQFHTSFPIKSEWVIEDQMIGNLGRAESCLNLRKIMQKDGWPFTPEDNQAWKDYTNNYLGYYLDDEETENYNNLLNLYNSVMPEDFKITPEKLKIKP